MCVCRHVLACVNAIAGRHHACGSGGAQLMNENKTLWCCVRSCVLARVSTVIH